MPEPRVDTPGAPPSAPRPAWGAFAASFIGTALVLLAIGVAVTVAVDPYWIFREQPPWLGWTGGANRHLDVEMRRTKPLQLLRRPAATVLVGSSVVYRGIDPSDLPGGGYNLGLSSLMADELPTVAGLAAVRGARRVLIGLDYVMFSGMVGPPRLDPRLTGAVRRAEALAGAAISLKALFGSLPSAIASAPEPGSWHRDGFKATPDYPAHITRRVAAEQDFAGKPYRPAGLADLDRALDRLAGTEVRLYLSPVSAAELRLIAAGGRLAEFERWRADVAALATRRGIAFADLSRRHGFDDLEPERGSSESWLDSLHFKPAVGRWILREVGAARHHG